MVRSASSSGVKDARFVSLLRRFTQYLQSYAQQFVIRTFNNVTHRPSAEKEWQHPATEDEVLPMYPFLLERFPPLDVQAASYFAASVRMVSFSRTSIAYSCGQRAIARRREWWERRAGRSIASIIRNSCAVTNATPNNMKNKVQPVISDSSSIELLFCSYHTSNIRSCQG